MSYLGKDRLGRDVYVDDSSGSSGCCLGIIGEVICGIFLGVCIIVVIIALIMLGFAELGARVGILRTRVEYTIEENEEYTGIDSEDVNIVFVANKGKYKSYAAAFDEENTANLKLHRGTYWISLECNDLVYYLTYCDIAGYGTSTGSIPTNIVLYELVLYITLYDTDGNVLTPDEFTLYIDEDTSWKVDMLMEDSYFMCLYLDTWENGTIEVRADGYKSVEVYYDELTRINRLSVVLEEE